MASWSVGASTTDAARAVLGFPGFLIVFAHESSISKVRSRPATCLILCAAARDVCVAEGQFTSIQNERPREAARALVNGGQRANAQARTPGRSRTYHLNEVADLVGARSAEVDLVLIAGSENAA